jgi:hypothetical protein
MTIQRVILLAAALLVVQLGLVAATYLSGRGTGEYRPGENFLEFARDAVDRVEITGEAGERLVLAKGQAGWVLAEHFNAPAAVAQVDALFDKLAGLVRGLVVAESPEAAGRFKVAADAFQRHVVLRAGESEVANLYVGTSPSFRQVHARRAGEEAVVTVNLSAFDLDTAIEQWLDKEQLKVAEEDLAEIIFPGFRLQRTDGGWALADLAEKEQANGEAVADLVLRVRSLTLQTVVDPAEAEALFAGEPDLLYTLVLRDNRRLEYRFAKIEAKDAYALRVTGQERIYQVHKLPVEALQKLNRPNLLAVPEPADAEEENGDTVPDYPLSEQPTGH